MVEMRTNGLSGVLNKHDGIFSIVLALIIGGIIAATILQSSSIVVDPLIMMLFSVISIYAGVEICVDHTIYSLNKVHWLFIFVFMGIAPLSQYMTGYYPHGYYVSADSIVKAQFIVILWCLFYSATYHIHFKKDRKDIYQHSVRVRHLPNIEPLLIPLIVLSFVSVMYLAFRVGGFEHLLLRGEAWIEVDSPIDTVLGYLLRSIPVLVLAWLLIQRKYCKLRHPILSIGLLFVLTIIANYPISLSRYWTAMVYIGLILCAIPSEWLGKRKFEILLLISICVIFPMMYQLKFVSFDVYIQEGITDFFINYAYVYNSPDFDAFSMLVRTLEYVDLYDFSFGRQILGSIFFFVPKALLAIKGTASGALVAIAQGSWYTNLSEPVMGEGYIDFGIIGVIGYAIIFARIFKYFDVKYWRTIEIQSRSAYIMIIVPFLIGFVVFLMRGALQPVVLRIFGFFLFLIFVFCLDIIYREVIRDRNNNV